jgi:hypothetical protein
MSAYEPANYVPENNNQEHQKKTQKKESYCYSLYMISHFIISFFAIYLSWRCNNGFNLLSFLVAFFCAPFYIIWALATNGGCGIFNDSSMSVVSPIRPIRY